jgi:hypothetical protein
MNMNIDSPQLLFLKEHNRIKLRSLEKGASPSPINMMCYAGGEATLFIAPAISSSFKQSRSTNPFLGSNQDGQGRQRYRSVITRDRPTEALLGS